jgi:hypothetical protein
MVNGNIMVNIALYYSNSDVPYSNNNATEYIPPGTRSNIIQFSNFLPNTFPPQLTQILMQQGKLPKSSRVSYLVESGNYWKSWEDAVRFIDAVRNPFHNTLPDLADPIGIQALIAGFAPLGGDNGRQGDLGSKIKNLFRK